MSLLYEVVAQLDTGHRKGVTCVSFSPNGQLLASGGLDHTVCVWNLSSEPYRLMHVFTGASPILSVAWKSNKALLCGLQDGTIATFALETWRVHMAGFPAHEYPVEHLAVREESLASAGQEDAFVWQQTAAARWSLVAHVPKPPDTPDHQIQTRIVTALHWTTYKDSPGSLLVCYLHHGISIIESTSWTCIRHISKSGLIASASLSDDKGLLATFNPETGYDIYRMASDEWIASFPLDEREPAPKILLPVLLVHGGRALLTGSATSSAQLWDIENKRTQQTLHTGGTRRRRVQALAAYIKLHPRNASNDCFMIATGLLRNDSGPMIVVWKAREVLTQLPTRDSARSPFALWAFVVAIIWALALLISMKRPLQ